ncbi:MAG: universal stress protein [Anaerolineae bacterium]|jgi:nucleotide-binding universal stress UspA family protein
MKAQILVPLDGSPLAEQALSYAITLGQSLPAQLVLLRAVFIPPDDRNLLDKAGTAEDVVRGQLEREAEIYLDDIVAHLQTAGLDARSLVQAGPAEEVIVDLAAQIGVQQIVMATHGYSGIKRWTHGSIAERVLQTASAPVLLVRAQDPEVAGDWQHPAPCQRILVPLDGSSMAEQVLPVVTDVARALHASLVLFQVPIAHVYGWMTGEWFLPVQGVLETAEEDAQAYLDEVAAGLEGHDVSVVTAMMIGSVAEAIIEHAQANRIDLIAMCTHGRAGLLRWTLGSVADRVLRAGRTPILLVRAA